MIIFNEFLKKVDNTYNDHSFVLRYGQIIMNTLYEVWPEKHKQITGGQYDCFYDDGAVKYTLDLLEKSWPNE
jgi:hypothetical protein